MIWVWILYNSSRGGIKNFIAIGITWVSNWDMSRYLAIIKVVQKFVLISNNNIFWSFHFVFLFCIKTGEWHFKGTCLCSLIIMISNNSLDSIRAGASSRHDMDEVFLDYSDFTRGAKLISSQNYIWMYEILKRGWICGSNITIKCFLSDYICLRRFIHYFPQLVVIISIL